MATNAHLRRQYYNSKLGQSLTARTLSPLVHILHWCDVQARYKTNVRVVHPKNKQKAEQRKRLYSKSGTDCACDCTVRVQVAIAEPRAQWLRLQVRDRNPNEHGSVHIYILYALILIILERITRSFRKIKQFLLIFRVLHWHYREQQQRQQQKGISTSYLI
jgi:hypothetical protein